MKYPHSRVLHTLNWSRHTRINTEYSHYTNYVPVVKLVPGITAGRSDNRCAEAEDCIAVSTVDTVLQ